MIGLLTAFCCY